VNDENFNDLESINAGAPKKKICIDVKNSYQCMSQKIIQIFDGYSQHRRVPKKKKQ